MFDKVIDFLQVIMPLILLVLGWWYAAKEKKRKKAEDEKENTLKKIETKIDTISADMAACKETDEKIIRELANVSMGNKINRMYNTELSELMITMAEGLRDNHLDGNITKAVEKYRTFEKNVLDSLVSGKLSPDKEDCTSILS